MRRVVLGVLIVASVLALATAAAPEAISKSDLPPGAVDPSRITKLLQSEEKERRRARARNGEAVESRMHLHPRLGRQRQQADASVAQDRSTNIADVDISGRAPTDYPAVNNRVDYDFNSLYNEPATPPDPVGCAGPYSFIALGNGGVALHSRRESQHYANIAYETMGDFFNEDAVTFDPRCYFDIHTDRFLVLVTDGLGPKSYLEFAHSKTNDPQSLGDSDWNFYRFDVQIGAETWWCDYPTLGHDSRAAYVSCNMYPEVVEGGSTSLLGGSLYRIDMGILATGSLSTPGCVTTLFSLDNPMPHTYDTEMVTMHVPQRIDANEAVETCLTWHEDGVDTTVANTRFYINKITNTTNTYSVNAGDQTTVVQLSAWGSGELIGSPQPGTDKVLSMGDRRLQHTVQVEDKLYVAVTARVDAATRANVHLVRIDGCDSAVPTTGMHHTVEDPVLWFAYPSVVADDQDNILLTYTGSGPDLHGSLYYSFYNASLSTWEGPTLLRKGESAYNFTVPPEAASARWGDYGNAMLDPVENWVSNPGGPTRAWTTHLYAGDYQGEWHMRSVSMPLSSWSSSPCSATPCTYQSPCYLASCPCDEGRQSEGFDCPNNCPQRCNGRGDCTFITRECNCFTGWTGTACSALDFKLLAVVIILALLVFGSALALYNAGAHFCRSS